MAPDRYDSRRRGVWSHWVPLAVTLTIATAGVAAWAWSQRKGSDEEGQEPGLDYDNADYGDNPPYGTAGDDRSPQQPPRSRASVGDHESYGVQDAAPSEISAGGWGTRMSGALRRTPSPQQFLDSTGKTVAAGFAAAGAAMGKALASIREEDKAYAGSNPWSEEADAKADRAPIGPSKHRRTVAVIVSADSPYTQGDADDYLEHASILSHIPRQNDFSKIKLFVLIYAPDLKETNLETATGNLPPPSLSSSFSNIGHEQAQPSEEGRTSQPTPTPSSAAYNAVYSQALAIVDKETMILPFTTPNGHTHILRHLQPEIIYLQESMAGDNGSIISNLQTWLRHEIVLVVGAEGGSGGLADSESEAERSGQPEKWWKKPERVGRGRGVVVVDGMRVNDDWIRRVHGVE
ncbi:peroxin 22-like protein [Emericellopsis atlantica]|uniref:Peroxin 22-like protein n=1 Tax=Emericellopsis atlantica TaxID=2614577 RepID=A0A9P7ZQI1_9HYPO|nr:peroxin 22-like protein [Emericellopsis atlantica]KAG9256256.1 peroxin 22-like protein [Emericellopsis atlantica]